MREWEEWAVRWRVRVGNEFESTRPPVAPLVFASLRLSDTERDAAERGLRFMRCTVVRDAQDDEPRRQIGVLMLRRRDARLVTLCELMEWVTGYALGVEQAQTIWESDDTKRSTVAEVWARDVLDIRTEHAERLFALAQHEAERMKKFFGAAAWSEALALAHDTEGD